MTPKDWQARADRLRLYREDQIHKFMGADYGPTSILSYRACGQRGGRNTRFARL
jgi:hypothetical protein